MRWLVYNNNECNCLNLISSCMGLWLWETIWIILENDLILIFYWKDIHNLKYWYLISQCYPSTKGESFQPLNIITMHHSYPNKWGTLCDIIKLHYNNVLKSNIVQDIILFGLLGLKFIALYNTTNKIISSQNKIIFYSVWNYFNQNISYCTSRALLFILNAKNWHYLLLILKETNLE